MKNFNFYNPTRIFFGKDETDKIGKLSKQYGDNVLLVYGKTAIKRNGLYDRVISRLKEENINVFELPGIDPNPRIESIREGGELCKKHKIDLVLAVGGGSVIDASKGIASAALYDGDPWDFYSYKEESKGALPIASILTLSATGSEMNAGSVVTNFATKEKNGWGSPFTNPKFSILDPVNTFSVSKHQTACGIVDALTHVYEFYFSSDQAYLNDRVCESIMKTVIHFGPIALKDPENFEARSNLMFSSTLALNGLSGFGKTWDGFNHTTEHLLSAYYDIAHADGLAILAPHWMDKILSKKTLNKFYEFAVNVWGVEESEDKMSVAKEGINRVYKFYEAIKMPLKLSDVEIIDPPLDELAKRATKNGTIGRYINLDYSDVLDILNKAL
ncbi:NADH-dependent alcohol dehydrogenase [Candidatus Izimaplasma bacterium ZiA1]|uniref:iron-containing alcohol dehydrogenase n=1 Tax=Candidatus Izimoplasma sp. ZiA1 TaxID=2024899 RepID=UPI000BAA8ECC|nr:NADH-dependent alcohol dehydrogenase [Candidatus Izimaplasma bacterium ZiA1]